MKRKRKYPRENISRVTHLLEERVLRTLNGSKNDDAEEPWLFYLAKGKKYYLEGGQQ